MAFLEVQNQVIRKFLLDKLAERDAPSATTVGNKVNYPIHQLAVYPPSNNVSNQGLRPRVVKVKGKLHETLPQWKSSDHDKKKTVVKTRDKKSAEYKDIKVQKFTSNSIIGSSNKKSSRTKTMHKPPEFLAATESEYLSNIGTLSIGNNKTHGDISLPIAAMVDSSDLLVPSLATTKNKNDGGKEVPISIYDRYERDGYLLFKGLLLTVKEKLEVDKIVKSIYFNDSSKKKKRKFLPNFQNINQINQSCQVINNVIPYFRGSLQCQMKDSKQATRPKGFNIDAYTGDKHEITVEKTKNSKNSKDGGDEENMREKWKELGIALGSLYNHESVIEVLCHIGNGSTHKYLKDHNIENSEALQLFPRIFHPVCSYIHCRAPGEFTKEHADWFKMKENTGFYATEFEAVATHLRAMGKEYESLNTSNKKGGKTDDNETEILVGDRVEVKYPENGVYYTATISKINKDGTYNIQYIEDGVKLRNVKRVDITKTGRVEKRKRVATSNREGMDGNTGAGDYDNSESSGDEGDICVVCGLGSDPASMLLCDECNSGYHCGCLDPPLEALPKQDWFCTDCASAPRPIVGKVWIPLEDHPLSDGVICLIPKSHKFSSYNKHIRHIPAALFKDKKRKQVGVECWVTSSFQPGDVLIYNPKTVEATSKTALSSETPAETMELFKKSVTSVFGICPLNRETWGETPSSSFMDNI